MSNPVRMTLAPPRRHARASLRRPTPRTPHAFPFAARRSARCTYSVRRPPPRTPHVFSSPPAAPHAARIQFAARRPARCTYSVRRPTPRPYFPTVNGAETLVIPHSMRSVLPDFPLSMEYVTCSTGALALASIIGARPVSSAVW